MGHLRPHSSLRFNHTHEPTVYVRPRQLTVSGKRGWEEKVAGPKEFVDKRTLSHIPSQPSFTFRWDHQRMTPDLPKTEMADTVPFDPSENPHLALISLVHSTSSDALTTCKAGHHSWDANENKTIPCLQEFTSNRETNNFRGNYRRKWPGLWKKEIWSELRAHRKIFNQEECIAQSKITQQVCISLLLLL